MRVRWVAALFALPLAGCGQGSAYDEAFRDSFRESAISGCATAGHSAQSAPAGFDWNRLCTCAVGRLMQGKSSAELRRLQGNSPEQGEAVRQCMAEMGAGPGAAPAPDSGPKPAA